MSCSAKYLEDAVYYEPWKTKYIESFCALHAKMRIAFLQRTYQEDYENFVYLFLNVYKLALNILQRKLKSEYAIKLKFYSDVIVTAKHYELISDEKMFFEILKFASQCHFDKKYIYKFDNKYLTILEEFNNKFKQLSKLGGLRNKNYLFYDNSYCLWGIKDVYYEELINQFLKINLLKIVRIFGSRVTDNYSEFSDIDLIFEGTYNAHEFIRIREKIRQFEYPYIVDIYDINHINKAFLYRNLIRSNIFYKRNDYMRDEYIPIF